jgi:hypothetical protein
MTGWDPEDVTAHLEHLKALNQELIDSGELVDMQALTGPELAKIVASDGRTAPVVTDGPFPEAKELLAGFQMIDVESEARAIEIAAKVSAAPGPGGVALRQRIEVRRPHDERARAPVPADAGGPARRPWFLIGFVPTASTEGVRPITAVQTGCSPVES